jgi:putative ABC transport system permease protein
MLPLQNLARRKVRTLFALLGIAVGISAVVSIVSTATGLRKQFYKIADQFGYDVIFQQRGAATPLMSHVSQKDRERILALPGIKSADSFAFRLVRRKDETKAQPAVFLGLEPGGEVLERYEILRGRALRPDDTNEIIIGELAAQQMNLDLGGTLETQDETGVYKVVGVFKPPVAGIDLLSGQGIVNINYLRKNFDVPTNLVIAHLRTNEELRSDKNPMTIVELDRTIAAIGSAMAANEKMSKRIEVKPFKSYVDSFKQMEIIDKFAWAMSFLAALVGGIGIANTMLMSVFERTREIGLLRAVGWSRLRICSLIVLEGLALSLMGGALGVPLGWLEVMAATKVVEMGWIQLTLDPVVAVEAVLLAIVIGVVGSLYPGLRAASLEPTEALRYE